MTPAPLRLDLAGERWEVEVPERWLPRFRVAFGHLQANEDREPGVRVSSRLEPTREEADWAHTLVAKIPDEDGIAAVENEAGRARVSRMSLESWDVRSGSGRSVLLDPAFESKYLGTNLLLNQIAWRAQARGFVPVHAAAVGDGEGFWLIPAAAGQGKSTTTAAAVAGGLRVLSDDFVLLDPKRRVLHSLYATIRLSPGSHRMIEEQFGGKILDVVASREDDKLLLTPGPATSAFARCGALKGILLLERKGLVRLGEVAASARALQAFSSTLRLLPTLGYPAPFAFRTFAELTRSVEARVLETGPDLHALVLSLKTLFGGVA